MVKKPKRKNKNRTKKGRAKQPEAKLEQPLAVMQPLPPQPEKTGKRGRFGAFLGVAGLVLTAITLIELFPRLSASATSPLDPDNQLASSRFTVSNDGYLQVTELTSACFLWNVVEGGFHAHGSVARFVTPPEKRLRPTEGYTVPCTWETMVVTSPPFFISLKTADLAIVTYYRWWPFTFYRTHRLFRFVARIGKNGEVVWDKQPTTEAMERGFDAWLQANGGAFPPAPPTIGPLVPKQTLKMK